MNPRLSPEWLLLPGVGRRPRGRRRLALEDRPDDALRRVRAVAPGVDGAPAARAADAVPRRARQPARGDGLGHRPGAGPPFLPPGGRCEILDDAGHFVHIEQPDARRRRWCSTSSGRNAMSERDAASSTTGSASPCTTCARATGRPLLLLHGLGEAAPADVPAWLDALDRAGRRPRLHRPRPLDDPRRRRLHVRDPARRRRHRPRRARPGDASSGAASAPTSPCSSPAHGPPTSSARCSPTARAWPAGRRSRRRRASSSLPRAEGPARPVRARRADPRPAPARLRRGVRPPGPRRLAARRADHRGRRLPPAVAGGRAAEPGVAHATIADALARYARC